MDFASMIGDHLDQPRFFVSCNTIALLLESSSSKSVMIHSIDEKLDERIIDAKEYDILLRDITPDSLKLNSSSVFGFEYNTVSVKNIAYPIEGWE
jgi:hypothetical protein